MQLLIFAEIDICDMDGVKFEMLRYGEEGAVWVDLEEEFVGLRYKGCTGLNSYGKVTGVYAEACPESVKADVYVSKNPAFEQTTIKLTLLFKEGEGAASEGKDDSSYHGFASFVSGCKVAYRDTARRRKVLMYLTGATEPKADTLYGKKYKEVTFTFTNVYGRSFGYGDLFPDE